MSHFSLSSLAQLLLKNQFELRDLLAQPSPLFGDGVNVGLRVGQASGSLAFGDSPDGLVLNFSDGVRSYKLVMPVRVSATEPFKVKVTLNEGDKTKEHVFEGADLFSAQVPEEFKALHARVLDYLKKVLPVSLLENLRAAAEAASPVRKDVPPAGAAEAASGTEEEFSWYHVKREDQADLNFRGKRIAKAETPLRHGRQNVYQVFVTPSGKYVGLKLGLSLWAGERDIATVNIAESAEALVPFFGYSPLAKALYAQLSLQTAEVVE